MAATCDVAEPIGTVQIENGGPVAVAQLLGVTPIAIAQPAGFVDRQAFADSIRIEETIPGDLDANQLVAGVAGYGILDLLNAGSGRLLSEIHRRIEITLRLEIIHQVAVAFEQEAAVDRAFLKDGDQLAEASLGNTGPSGVTSIRARCR